MLARLNKDTDVRDIQDSYVAGSQYYSTGKLSLTDHTLAKLIVTIETATVF